jgi:uncharacterized FAD-dependent dehydrogenase
MQVSFSIPLNADNSIDNVFATARKKSGIKNPKVLALVKKSVDARDKGDIRFFYAVEIDESPGTPFSRIEPPPTKGPRPVVIGAGPCGLFCALILAKAGLCPMVFERGADIDKRISDTEEFIKSRILNTESNVQFGEGGAGAFSDGKLNTNIRSGYIPEVLRTFVEAGAPEDILYLNRPHLGTDKLPAIIKNIREKIIGLGGEFLFNSKIEDLVVSGSRVKAVVCGGREFPAEDVVLAIGHSARDMYGLLMEKGFKIEVKSFSAGFRIEHLQKDINRAQYGGYYNHPSLPPAEYMLVAGGVYTFCMCPGGSVVFSSSVENTIVTNGMSRYKRDGINANSALLATVGADMFKNAGDAIRFQEAAERAAFISGGGDYTAPAMTVGAFLNGKKNEPGRVLPTIETGIRMCDLSGLFPAKIISPIKNALKIMGGRLKGFDAGDALLTGVETRSSSPVRIVRDENFESVIFKGIYPAGEGCGYAGGIMSAACDGIKIALGIVGKYNNKYG